MSARTAQHEAYVAQHQDRFLEELFQLLRIASVSADPAYKQQVFDAAGWVENHMVQLGLDQVKQLKTPGFPVVYGEKMVDPAKPTVLVYGHYDVQPPDPLDLWETEPFEPTIRNGKIYARGASDDKGQAFMHLKAFELLQSHGELPCNVKVMFEGEEEVGSEHLDDFLVEHQDLLKADLVLVSDTGILSMDQPSITVGLRGMAYLEVKVTGPNRDLHSGLYGGAVVNPLNALCKMVAQLHDQHGKVDIPGFYDRVQELPLDDREAMARAPHSDEAFMEELGLPAVGGEAGFSTLERIGIRPTLDLNGIWGGYTGEGAKTVLPSWAKAKLSMRLVPDQDNNEIAQLAADRLKALAPKGVTVEVKALHGGLPSVVPTDSPGFQAGSAAFEALWGKRPIPMRDGGSIPIVNSFKRILGLDTVLLGFGLGSDAIHSPNEHFGVANFTKGIATIAEFHHQLSDRW